MPAPGLSPPNPPSPPPSTTEGLLARLLEEGTITQDDVAGGSHCMAPAFLNASLHRSLGG